MKLVVNAEILKDMVSRAVKGAGNNKLIPITSLMKIQQSENGFELVTTDATNYLYVKEDKIVGDDFYAVVPVDVFSKLISKVTSETVALNIKNNILIVTANGSYSIELPLDENGEAIKYPDPFEQYKKFKDSECIINRSTVGVILETVKPALAITLENPCYTGYYVGDKIVATDTYKIASMDVELFGTNMSYLISPELMNLLAVMSEEKIEVYFKDNDIIFKTDNCIIVGKVMEGIEEYAIEAISNLVDTEFDSKCKIPKAPLLQLLDRLSLFVGTYDKNAVRLTFTKDGLQVESKASSGVEIIKYVDSQNFREFTCLVDISMLTQEVKAIQSDMIELYYGEDNAIKFVDSSITIIVALLEDEVEE